MVFLKRTLLILLFAWLTVPIVYSSEDSKDVSESSYFKCIIGLIRDYLEKKESSLHLKKDITKLDLSQPENLAIALKYNSLEQHTAIYINALFRHLRNSSTPLTEEQKATVQMLQDAVNRSQREP